MDTKALRQKILDLAIHGKLVPQDPNDEPASVLLQRIREEKERLIKEGKIKKGKKSAKTSDTAHYPYLLPEGWEWCKLEDIAYVASGSTPAKEYFVPKGIPFIKMYNLRNQQIDFDFKPQYITEEVHNGKLQRSRTEVGDLIMNIVGPPLGKLAIIPPTLPQANFNQAAVLIRPYLYKGVINHYLKSYLEEMSEINSITTRGCAGQVNISLSQSQNMRIPLPPLAEQRRIVKEIERLFSLIDIIENGKESLKTAVKQAKAKILDLAIHGKLVHQDPNDEPASELLRRINPKAEITSDNAQYGKVPQGWCVCRLSSIVKIINGKSQKDVEDTNGPYPIYGSGGIIGKANQYLCEAGSTIIGRKGTINCPIFVRENFWNVDTAFGMKPIQGLSDEFYFYFCNYFDFSKLDKSTALPSLTKRDIGNIVFPLPPLAEQKRIVAKIEELFAQLDRIEAVL